MPKKIALFLFVFALVLSFPSPILAQTQTWAGKCKYNSSDFSGVTTTSSFNANSIATLQGIECIFANILRLIIPFAGLIAFVILLIGGFHYITSAGDPKQTQKAQSMITGSIIGIAVLVGIWFLFRFLSDFTGINLFQFVIPG